MERLLSGLLGFFFTVTILLVLLENCGFSFGCGGSYKREYFNPYAMAEGFTNKMAGCGCMVDEY